MNLRTLILAALLTGCATTRTAAPAEQPAPAPVTDQEKLPFIENDYARAVQEARTRQLPLFVDVWAPW